jgi:hypothetical protein
VGTKRPFGGRYNLLETVEVNWMPRSGKPQGHDHIRHANPILAPELYIGRAVNYAINIPTNTWGVNKIVQKGAARRATFFLLLTAVRVP